jgi:hypothetical protein
LTFPDDQDLPTQSAELAESAAAFGLPEGGIGLRDNAAVSTAMKVPETAVDKDHLTMTRKNDIWFPGECLIMKPKSKTHSVNQRANMQFGCSIFVTNTGHIV